jgi:adenylate cyclase
MNSKRQLAAIMFTDIVGYSAMMQADEQDGHSKANRYRQALEQYVEKHDGEIIQHYGDGSLSVFSSAVEAVGCAIDLQIVLKEEPQVPLRAGIHIGDIVIEGQEIYGNGVNIASRVESMGVANSILISDSVYKEVKNWPEIKTTSLGLFDFKNIETPVQLYAIANKGLVVPKEQDMRGKGRKK